MLCMDVLHTLRDLTALAILNQSAKMEEEEGKKRFGTQSGQFYDSTG